MKIFILTLFTIQLIYSSMPAMAADCGYPNLVTWCPEVGAQRELDPDTTSAVDAIANNLKDFQALTRGRNIMSIRVKILPSKDPSLYSLTTQYVFYARPTPDPIGEIGKFDVKLILNSYGPLTPGFGAEDATIWESSGVIPASSR